MSQFKRVKRNTLFFRVLVARQLRQDYLENVTGLAWLILQPLALLAIYAFVFTTIFQPRIASGEVSFVAFLAVAMWPWIAFSEGVIKGSGSVQQNAALITKVAFASEQLPIATVTATFIAHGLGYLVVLALLTATGTPIHWVLLPIALGVMVLLWFFAVALSLFASALNVFIKDVAQILPPLMTFWFFMTPIIYSREYLPERFASILELNLMTWFVEEFRALFLFGRLEWPIHYWWVPLILAVIFWLALRFFRRLAGHFEDFV